MGTAPGQNHRVIPVPCRGKMVATSAVFTRAGYRQPRFVAITFRGELRLGVRATVQYVLGAVTDVVDTRLTPKLKLKVATEDTEFLRAQKVNPTWDLITVVTDIATIDITANRRKASMTRIHGGIAASLLFTAASFTEMLIQWVPCRRCRLHPTIDDTEGEASHQDYDRLRN